MKKLFLGLLIISFAAKGQSFVSHNDSTFYMYGGDSVHVSNWSVYKAILTLRASSDGSSKKAIADSGRVGANYVTGGTVKKVIDSILAAVAAGYSTTSHTHTFGSLASKPTTKAGYGITDVVAYADTAGILGNYLTGLIATNAAISLKAPLTSPTFTGTAALPTVTTSGKITNYNSIATVSNGVPSIVAEVNLTTQAANIGSTALYAVPAAGFYRVSSYLTVTQAATTSSTMPSLTIGYTDGNSGTNLHSTAVSATSATNTVTGAFGQSTYVLYAKAGTNITYQTASYATSGTTPMQYSLRIRVEAL